MKSRHLLLASLLGLGTALSMDRSFELGARASNHTCVPGKGLASCPSNLPFCCPSTTTCIPTLQDNTSVICCPQGQTCNFIEPITCDIQQQNQTRFPANAMHTSQLDAIMATCGTQCCPLGYTCNNGMCIMTKAQPTLSSSSSAQPTSTSTSSSSATTTAVAASAAHSSGLAPGVIAGIVIGTLALFSLICMLILLCLKRRRHNRETKPNTGERNPYSPDFMGTTPRPFPASPSPAPNNNRPEIRHIHSAVSEPRWAPDYGESHRTDFLLRRGSNQTGFEQQNQPSWSTNNKGATDSKTVQKVPDPSATSTGSPQKADKSRVGQSFRDRVNDRSNPSDRVPFTDPYTPNPDMQERSEAPRHPPCSRLTPLFQTPLRLGLATQADGVTPLTKRKTPPKRPRRSDEPRVSIAQALNLNSLKHKPSGTFITGRKTPTAASTEDDSQRKPLVREDTLTKFRDQDRRNNAQGLTRSSSDATAFSDTSSVHFEAGPHKPNHDSHESSETINVLLPPPSVFESPPPPLSARKGTEPNTPDSGLRRLPRDTGHERPETSFEGLLKEAGWRTSAWKS